MIRLLLPLAMILAARAETMRPLEDFPARWTTHGGDWSLQGGTLQVEHGEGPKVSIDRLAMEDFQLDVRLRAAAEGTQVGVVFRGSDFAAGVDAFCGYYAGITAGRDTVVWGAVDPTWRTIASRPFEIEPDTWYHLRLRVRGENVKLYLAEDTLAADAWPVFDGIDAALSKGSIALRALGGEASFRDLRLSPAPPAAAGPTYTNPVRPGGADPVVFLHEGTYYAYTTYTPDSPRMPRGIRLYTSPDLVGWQDRGFALENKDSWGRSRYWAPDIVEKDGTFFLYYAADERMCVATADSPLGPFRQEKQAPMEPESLRIDGHVFEDDDGSRYFYYVTFNQGNEIWGGRLHDDMTSVDPDSLKLMVRPDQPWERHQAPITEGAEILKHEGTYYLTYSGSHFESPEYAVGYATSDHPLGPWKKYPLNPVMKATTYAPGSAHHCFTTSPDGREIFIVYHSHHAPGKTEPRQLSIDRVRFIDDPAGGPDILQIHGPTRSPQPMPSGTR